MAAPDVPDAPAKKAIIVVEDTQQIADLIKETLNEVPEYQAIAVYDGALALEVIRSVRASLIILDVNLPGIDGVALYDMLQEEEDLKEVPVLFVTASTQDREFKERKFENVLAKPFDLDELLEAVSKLCRP